MEQIATVGLDLGAHVFHGRLRVPLCRIGIAPTPLREDYTRRRSRNRNPSYVYVRGLRYSRCGFPRR